MRIESSALGLQSVNNAYSLYEKKERLQVKTGEQSLGFAISSTQRKATNSLQSMYQFKEQDKDNSLKEAADKIGQQVQQNNNQSTPISNQDNTGDSFAKLSLRDKIKLLLLALILGRLRDDPELMKRLGLGDEELLKAEQNSQTPPPPASAAPSVEYSAQETVYQSETTQFSAQGVIKTADGQTINISVDLLMHRESIQTNDTYMRIQAITKDPLVINLDGSAAELSDQRFSFDLTSDGINELIPKLVGNRGFLALDKNNDQVINNGTELFGAQTGNGFAELAQYDEDQNGWIDENDSIFNQLKLWINAGSAQQKLLSLKEVNIGALYTGATATPFQLQDKKDMHNNLGTIQATGIFLKETGEAGTIQHVDLTV